MRSPLSPARRATSPAIVLHNSNIQNIAELKGKTIAVSTTGSLSDWLAKQMAIQEGWGQDGIRAAPLGAIPTSIAALKTRQVDAVVLATEAGFRLEEQKEGHVLATMDRYAPNFITHVVFAQKSLVPSNPDLVTRFLRGFFDAIAFVEDPQGRDVTVGRARLADEVRTLARRVYDLEAGMFLDDGRFDPPAVATLKQSFIDMKTLRSEPADAGIVHDAIRAGQAVAKDGDDGKNHPGRRRCQSQRDALASRA